MHIIIIADSKSAGKYFSLGGFRIGAGIALLLLLLIGAFQGGTYLHSWNSEQRAQSVYASAYEDATLVALRELDEHRSLVEQANLSAQMHVNALALRLSRLQAQTFRLEALGARLINMAGLDEEEFDLNSTVALGGPRQVSESGGWGEMDGLLEELNALARRINDRADKLYAVEYLLLGQDAQSRAIPAGTPVVGGWISSHYGLRTDPFSGQREFHSGVDISGRRHSKVLAVASGIVTRSGSRAGYGNLVVLNHGEGYTTLYGHNKSNLVQVGQWVEKGQPIAVMGSTGRSTGTHVHFEVHNENKPLNPKAYISLK